MAQWAHSSIWITFGFKMHIVADERQKIFGFTRKPENLHDVICAEELLRGCRGLVVGDKAWCSEPLAKRLSSQGLRFITRHKQNMTSNSEERQRVLTKPSIIETVIVNFENFFGATFSRFQYPRVTFSAICTGILAVNFPL
jgi:hypothetical protein